MTTETNFERELNLIGDRINSLLKQNHSYSPIRISNTSFQKIKQLVYESSGIDLPDRKRALVVSRLQKKLFEKGFRNFEEYTDYLEQDRTGKALEELINRITTNHTFFYREKTHFDFFTQHVLEKQNNELRVWSAGCSTGEEPFMLAMLILDYFRGKNMELNGGILATDISTKVLTDAMKGEFPDERLTHLPSILKKRYFKRNGKNWAISDEVKKIVTFRRLNLMSPSFPFKKQFHAIFCRNVMIYFDMETRYRLVDKFHEYTIPGGYLFIGHSESLVRESCPFKYILPAVYRKEK